MTNILALRTTSIALRTTLSASYLKRNQTLCIPRILLAPQFLDIQAIAICDFIDLVQGAAALELLVHVLFLLHFEIDANVVAAISEFRQIDVDEVADIACLLGSGYIVAIFRRASEGNWIRACQLRDSERTMEQVYERRTQHLKHEFEKHLANVIVVELSRHLHVENRVCEIVSMVPQ
jgi:hypothetical protein